MNVRGVAFLARRALLVREHGEAAWRSFLETYCKTDPSFREQVQAVTNIPAEKFLAFNDALVARFAQGDPQAYWKLGESSAEWALTEGQNRGVFKPGEFRRYLFAGSAIYSTYFDRGTYKTTHGAGFTDVTIREVPIHHPYFELSVMGYLKKGLELLGAKDVRWERLAGFTKGDDFIHYRFWVS